MSASAHPSDFTFDSLPAELVEALSKQGIVTPTAVQAAVIPDGLAGHDVLGRAQTGSGKTLAFGIPVLARLAGERSRPGHPRAVIVVPTRELAQQLSRALTPLAYSLHLKLVTVYGGTPYDRQVRGLKNRADIVVATPGRLEDLINKGACHVDDVQVTVLDEADHLCDLGFYPAIDKLVGMTPTGSQRMLLSATLDGDVDRLVRKHLRSPKLHQLDPNAGAVSTMEHHTLVVGGFRDKVAATKRLVEANGSSIIFTRTREGAVELSEALTAAGVEAVDLHGNLSQRVRERNLQKFSSGKVQAVVATDVAARGIHVDNVDIVIHFDAASDAKAYLHRSGRTARAGKSGCVVTISTPKFADQIARLQRGAGVEVLHHDLRTAPSVLTAEALAASGTKTPARSPQGPRSGGGRPAGQGGSKPYRGQGGGPRRYEGASRPDGRRPSTGGRAHGAGSGNNRWADKTR
ncbi:DEAD/DEAH box helicase [Nocardioides sp.]|uniref:DEAD/DEAH box helicase n=1 Tax=Nocardioides sp. TaxID=35761 RepID=UPI0031FE9DD0|nr:box helicase [Nocardioides sp.]